MTSKPDTVSLRNPRALAAGDKAIYPGVGPCLVGRIEKRMVDARAVMFYHLIVLDGSHSELFIPVEKAGLIGVRLLIEKSEILKLLDHLRETGAISDIRDNGKQRANDHSKLLASGSPFDVAEIVRSLTERSVMRSLTVDEARTLGKARRMLVCEISEVMGETTSAAEDRLDDALAGIAEQRSISAPRETTGQQNE